MLKIIAIGSLLFLVFAAVSGCGSSPQPGAEADRITNSEVIQRVRVKLDSEPALKAARLGIDTDMARKEVTLSGTVENPELRLKAVSLAQSAIPGLTIKDSLTVAGQVTTPEPKAQPKKGAKTPPKKKSRKGH